MNIIQNNILFYEDSPLLWIGDPSILGPSSFIDNRSCLSYIVYPKGGSFVKITVSKTIYFE